jgi:hypothetical protein
LVRSDYGSINDRANVVDLKLQLLEYFEPDPAVRPIREPIVNRLPWTKALRQITPRNACLGAIEDCIDELPITDFGSRALSALWKQLAKTGPLFVGQCVTVHRKLGSHSGSWSKFSAKKWLS